MDKAALAALIAPTRTVEVEGVAITLKAPPLAAVEGLLRTVRETDEGDLAGYTRSLAEAMAAVVDVEPALSEDEAAALIRSAGGPRSDLVQALMELAGLRVEADDEEPPDELPS